MENMNSIFGIVALFCGLYALRSWYLVKKTGDVKKSVLYPSGNGSITKQCRDKDGYRKETLPKLLFLAITVSLYGGAELYNALVTPIGSILILTMILLGIVLLWVMVSVKKMNDKYF